MNGNQIFFFDGEFTVYWHGVMLACALLVGCALLWGFARTVRRGAARQLRFFLLAALPLAVVLSRAQYCAFRTEEFSGILDVLRLTDGGMGLYGAMIGVAAAAVISRALDRTLSAAELFDCTAAAGSAAVCIGRLSCMFSGEELGVGVTNTFMRRVLFTAYNEGENMWQVKVYLYEAIAAAVIFVLLAVTFVRTYRTGRYSAGTAACRFLLWYPVTQTLLESWRLDSLFLNTLGFVRFSQALSAVIFAVMLVIFCIRYAKRRGFTWKQPVVWVLLAAFIALAFTCEFTMTGNTRIRNYSGMALGLGGVLVIGDILLRRAYIRGE